jgi:hypothetical protein
LKDAVHPVVLSPTMMLGRAIVHGSVLERTTASASCLERS